MELSHIAKLNFILHEDAKILERAKKACEKYGLNTHISIRQALNTLIEADPINTEKHPDISYHDIAHIAGLTLNNDLKSEVLTAITERVLLREAYNGNENRISSDLSKSFSDMGFSAPGAHQQAYIAPLPVCNFEDARALALERLELLPLQYPEKRRTFDQSSLEGEMRQIYKRALKIDKFFCTLMGERAVYNICSAEFDKIPVAFLGVNPKTQPDGSVSFTKAPDEICEAILKEIEGKQPALHHAEKASYMTVETLKKLYPLEKYPDIEYPEA